VSLPFAAPTVWPVNGGWPIRPSCGRVGLFVTTTDVSSFGLRGPFLRNPLPATDTFRLSHPTVTGALSHPPPLSEHSRRGEGVVSLASVPAHSVDRKRLSDISACPAAAAGSVHTCMECMTKLCHTSMQCMPTCCMTCMCCMISWASKNAPNQG
jgi:hypothetical protein